MAEVKPGRVKGRSTAAARPPKGGKAKGGDEGRGAGPSVGAAPAKRDRGNRAERRTERREAILAAALDLFSVRGFADTRLDDVAKRAGIAKGTIYLYFHDKEHLFQELVRSMLSPLVGRIEAAPIVDLPVKVIVQTIVDLFVREICGTRRKDVIRLIIAEGPRFPKLAEFYYREVIARVVKAVRGLLTRAVERGELKSDALARFPQLLVAPGLVAIVWNGLFGRFAPLDVEELMRAHLNLLFDERGVT